MESKQFEWMKNKGYIVNLKGKYFVTFQGLVTVAHNTGLISIETKCIHDDWEKGHFAFSATVKGIKKDSDQVVTFTDQGDGIAPHVRRMASTRAICRALRLYTGISYTSREELGGDE
jgi:hypothetical protein